MDFGESSAPRWELWGWMKSRVWVQKKRDPRTEQGAATLGQRD